MSAMSVAVHGIFQYQYLNILVHVLMPSEGSFFGGGRGLKFLVG